MTINLFFYAALHSAYCRYDACVMLRLCFDADVRCPFLFFPERGVVCRDLASDEIGRAKYGADFIEKSNFDVQNIAGAFPSVVSAGKVGPRDP